MTPRQQRRFLQMLSMGATEDHAARMVGLQPQTVYRYRDAHRHFYRQYAAAYDAGVAREAVRYEGVDRHTEATR